MIRAPRWRVRGGNPKEEQKEGWVLVGQGHPASNRRGLSSGSSLLAEMNGLEGGWILYFRAGREVKTIREDCPPGKEDGKKVLSSTRPVSRGVGNPDRLRESLVLFSPSFRQQRSHL
ncbi:unnamed protein product [Lactuca virosa]|uniref:Uncharacterized protein n=1 Tax=Lactuca virosa TaxID=75947 RepID=A0AAU9PQ43_9ASTR|nr:unnamed protein product [Lactuca virosa]